MLNISLKFLHASIPQAKKNHPAGWSGVVMKPDELLFELRAPDGHVWRLYLDGRSEGFPAGTVVSNFASVACARMVGEVVQQPGRLAAE